MFVVIDGSFQHLFLIFSLVPRPIILLALLLEAGSISSHYLYSIIMINILVYIKKLFKSLYVVVYVILPEIINFFLGKFGINILSKHCLNGSLYEVQFLAGEVTKLIHKGIFLPNFFALFLEA